MEQISVAGKQAVVSKNGKAYTKITSNDGRILSVWNQSLANSLNVGGTYNVEIQTNTYGSSIQGLAGTPTNGNENAAVRSTTPFLTPVARVSPLDKSKQESILRQVAFKGAIEITASIVNEETDRQEIVELVKNLTNQFNEFLQSTKEVKEAQSIL